MKRLQVVIGLGVLAVSARTTLAHHSSAAVYDRDAIVEAEGEITAVSWTNPHVRFKVSGGGKTWDIESNSVSIVSRLGLSEALVKVGEHVKLAGNSGRQRDDVLWVTNMLLPDGREILFGAAIAPRWSDRTVGNDIRGPVSADSQKLGLFRVWTNVTSPAAFWARTFPLTPAAEAARAKFRPGVDDPTQDCTPKGMTYIMEQPYPIELVKDGGDIALKMEEYDTIRHIAMTAKPAKANAPRLGVSTGRWDGGTLVVDTANIGYAHFDGRGIPLGKDARVVERFSLNPDGSRLQYTMTVTDPATFTVPVTLEKEWEWRPGEQVRPYNCVR